jgi:hypothetical protein
MSVLRLASQYAQRDNKTCCVAAYLNQPIQRTLNVPLIGSVERLDWPMGIIRKRREAEEVYIANVP